MASRVNSKRLWLGLSLCVLFWTAPVVAREWVHFNFFNNVGGLNDGFDNVSIADNEASDLSNVVFTVGGAISQRQGVTHVNLTIVTGNPAFTGIHYRKQANTSEFLVAVFDDDTIRKMDYSANKPDGTWDNITGTASFNATVNDLADFAEGANAAGDDLLVIADGLTTTTPWKWDGSADVSVLGGGPPNCSIIEYHKLHLFCAGTDGNRSRVTFSNLGDIETWTSVDFFEIEQHDGSVVRGMISGLDALYIWKDRSIWRLSGTDKDTFILEQMVKGTGALSQQSIATIDNQFLFVTSQNEIAFYDGGVTIQILSVKIDGTLTDLNDARFADASAVEFDGDYYVALSDVNGTTHDVLLVFDTTHGAWTRFDGLAPNALTVANFDGSDQLVFGDYLGFASTYPTGTSDTVASSGPLLVSEKAIDSFYTTKWYCFPEIKTDKVWRSYRLFVEEEGTGDLHINARADFEIEGETDVLLLTDPTRAEWDIAIWDQSLYAGLQTIIGRFETGRTKDCFQLHFSNDDLDETWTLKFFQLYLEVTGRL